MGTTTGTNSVTTVFVHKFVNMALKMSVSLLVIAAVLVSYVRPNSNPHKECGSRKVKCTSGCAWKSQGLCDNDCIPCGWRLDGEKDCTEGEDENYDWWQDSSWWCTYV